MPRLPPQHLTVGFEWEFLIPRATGEDSHPEDDRFYVDDVDLYPRRDDSSLEHSADIFPIFTQVLGGAVPFLTSVSPFAKNKLGLEGENTQEAEIKAEAKAWDLTLAPGRPMPFSYFWNIGTDVSLEARPDEDVVGDYAYGDFSMELRSRVLAEDELYELHRVYKQLRLNLRINVNSSCSMHVHVGTGHLDFAGLQKLTTLVMYSESFLWRCCEKHRPKNEYSRGINTNSEASFLGRTQPVPANPILEALLPWCTPPNLRKIVNRVWSLPTVDLLCTELLRHSELDRCAFALRASRTSLDCTGAVVASDQTAEFRYSHSSGDPERDEKFARVCISLVKAASLEPEPFKATLLSFMAGRRWVDFLRPLDLEADVDFWTQAEQQYRHKAENPGPAPSFLPEI